MINVFVQECICCEKPSLTHIAIRVRTDKCYFCVSKGFTREEEVERRSIIGTLVISKCSTCHKMCTESAPDIKYDPPFWERGYLRILHKELTTMASIANFVLGGLHRIPRFDEPATVEIMKMPQKRHIEWIPLIPLIPLDRESVHPDLWDEKMDDFLRWKLHGLRKVSIFLAECYAKAMPIQTRMNGGCVAIEQSECGDSQM